MDLPPSARAVWEAVGAPLAYVAQADQRLFWLYLMGALALALGVLRIEGRFHLRSICGLLTPRVWLHRSALLDYQLLFAKPVIHALLFGPWLFSAYGLSLWTVGRLEAGWGIPGPSDLSPWTVRVLYTLVLFVCWDASRYVVHRLAHWLPFLWELHKVHHSAEVMTPFTIYRSHPLESLLFKLRGALVTGVVSGIFFHFFRGHALQYELLGVNAAGFILNTLGGNLRHSHVWLRYPRWLERIFISPAQHQLHHSSVLEQCHSNFGSWLAIWDWLAGSLRHSGERRPTRFGLPLHQRNHSQRLGSALVAPLWACARRLTSRPTP